MAEIDLEALHASNEALTIIFIILIFLANAGLIIKIVWRNLSKFTLIYDYKKLTIVSLAIGDVLLSLFALVVRARGLFDREYRYENTHCRNNLSHVYSDLLIQFVYGMGLVVLAVELIFRLRQLISQSTTGCLNIIMAYIVSAIPWGLGLVIVLSLTLAGMDWDNCSNRMGFHRLRAVYIVSLCVPASLALLAGILVMFVPQSNNPPSEAPPVSQTLLQTSSTNGSYDSSTEHTTTPVPAKASYADDSSTKHMPTPPVPAQALCPGSPPPYLGYAHSQPPNYPQQFNVYIPQPPSNQPQASVNFNKEKGTILLIAIVYNICVLPYAIFIIGHVLNLNQDAPLLNIVTETVLVNLFYWLLLCRSVVAPLIWICRL